MGRPTRRIPRLTDDGGYAVGAQGTVLSRSRGGWIDEATGITTAKAFHSVWVDLAQGVWAVGGDGTGSDRTGRR